MKICKHIERWKEIYSEFPIYILQLIFYYSWLCYVSVTLPIHQSILFFSIKGEL